MIWGAASPDPEVEGDGFGVTLWDFEANRVFLEANDPGFDELDLDRGRFAALYGTGPDEDNPAADTTFVVAAFRNFVPSDDPDGEPADLDYFYGRYSTDEETFDFLDFEAEFDIDEPADGMSEAVGVRMAFYNEGVGRAESDATGGSLGSDSVSVVECWDSALEQTYVNWDGTEEGNVISCGAFASTLDELSIPGLEDVDSEILAGLDDVAENGIPE